MVLLNLLFPALSDAPGGNMNKFTVVLTFFIKVHFNLLEEDLAFHFGVNKSNVQCM